MGMGCIFHTHTQSSLWTPRATCNIDPRDKQMHSQLAITFIAGNNIRFYRGKDKENGRVETEIATVLHRKRGGNDRVFGYCTVHALRRMHI
jgi:hypothetical protein